jgi:ATP-binding cassette subfamily B multidrug efflux pump
MIDQDDLQSSDKKTEIFKSIKTLLQYAKPYQAAFVFSLLLLITSSSVGVFAAYALGQLVEKLIQSTQQQKILSSVINWSLFIIGLEFLSVMANYFGRKILGVKAARALLDIRISLFRKLTELPLKYYDTQPLGRIVTRVTYDVENLDEFFTGTFARLSSAMISLVVVFGSMLLTDFKLGLLMSLSALPAFFVSMGIRDKIRHWNIEMARKNSAINAQLSEYLSGFSVIRAFGLEAWTQSEFDKKVDNHLYVSLKFNVMNAWSRPVILFLCYLPLLVLLVWGGKSVFAGSLSLGLFVAFARYSERFSRPILAIAQEIHMVQTAMVNIERVSQVLEQETELDRFRKQSPEFSHKKDFETLVGPIEFKSVHMTYSEVEKNSNPEWVLKNLNFRIEAGQKIGLAGATGSGKTTTLALLSRLYDFQKGEILFGHDSLKIFSPSSLRRKIGYVSQDVVIFKGSLRENLCLGQNINDQDLLQLAQKTGLQGIMKSRGIDLNSEILDLGANLSQGEKQLISLTRVLAQNPLIIILDEATSSIDPELEKTIQNAVDLVMKGRTSFIIAHRLSTLKNCDRILVFKNGEIIEQGTEQDLDLRKGYFSELLSTTS